MLTPDFPQGKAYQVNVTDAKHVEESITAIVKEFNGRLDIFVANAGVPWTQGAMLDGEIDHYHKVIATDLDSAFYCARAAGAHWRRQKKEGTDLNGKKLENYTSGSFVATASMSGHVVNIPQLQAAYNAAKAAVIHLGMAAFHLPAPFSPLIFGFYSSLVGCGMGSVCSCQHRLPWLHGHRNFRFRTERNQGYVEG